MLELFNKRLLTIKQMVLLITNNTSLDTIKNIYQIKDTSKNF